LYIYVSFLLLFGACSGNVSNQSDVLFDFESDNELDLFTWKCPSMFSISDEWSKNGKSSLKFEFYPARQIGFSSGKVKRNWSGSKNLVFTVYNPSAETTELHIRISDNLTEGDPDRAYVTKLVVRPGENTLRLPVGSYIDSNGRSLDLENMMGIYVYKKEVVSREVLFFDYFWMER
jgi:hypothetical protein